MVTTEHTKVRVLGNQPKNYISYFQSVTTIGIINRARTSGEAEAKARIKLDNSDFMCGVVGQTPFELHATDEWQPEYLEKEDLCEPKEDWLEELPEPPKLDKEPIILNLDEQTRRCIADKIGKDLTSITHEDCLSFVKWSLNQGLA
jgi:hypothetical protein